MFGIDDAIAAGANLITKILDKVAPDADEAEKDKLTLALTEMQNEYATTLKQIDVDNTEATNPHWFVAGWRPFVGWVWVWHSVSGGFFAAGKRVYADAGFCGPVPSSGHKPIANFDWRHVGAGRGS